MTRPGGIYWPVDEEEVPATAAALCSPELALAQAERDEYRRNWRDAEHRVTSAERLLAVAERARGAAVEARDAMQDRLDAALGQLEAKTALLAELASLLASQAPQQQIHRQAPRLAADKTVAAHPRAKSRGECGVCGRDVVLRLDGRPQAHRTLHGGARCNGLSA